MQNTKAADNIQVLRYCVPKFKVLASLYHPLISSSETTRCEQKNNVLLMADFSHNRKI
jgi:hypothetical protein